MLMSPSENTVLVWQCFPNSSSLALERANDPVRVYQRGHGAGSSLLTSVHV